MLDMPFRDRALIHPIAVELRRAWGKLGGNADMYDSVLSNRSLYSAFEHAGADSELLAVIGSYGDTLQDSSVLKYLREWNAAGPVITHVVAKV